MKCCFSTVTCVFGFCLSCIHQSKFMHGSHLFIRAAILFAQLFVGLSPSYAADSLESLKSNSSRLVVAQSRQSQCNNWPWGERCPDPPRDGGVCLISPNRSHFTSWSDRPLFLWYSPDRRAVVTQIEILGRANSVVFSYSLSEQEQQLQRWQYNGDPLQRGERYRLRITYRSDSGTGQPQTEDAIFQIMPMDDSRYQQIQDGLDVLNSQGSFTENQRRRAELFAQQGLPLDALREQFSETSLPTAVEVELQTSFCSSN